METKDIWQIVLLILGWGWAVAQFFINRSNHKRDKQIERRFEVYSAYMKRADELMYNLRWVHETFLDSGLFSKFSKKVHGFSCNRVAFCKNGK